MSTVTASPSVLNFEAAAQLLDNIITLDGDQQDVISDSAAGIIDYSYWYSKALETAREHADSDERAELIADLDTGDRLISGAALATLVSPLIGHGVHRAQLELLTAGYASLDA